MAALNEVAPFPNPGVRLIKEDEHVAIWEETFEPGKPTPPHRHLRDYIAIFRNAGELTLVPVAGEREDIIVAAGELIDLPARNGGVKVGFTAGTVIHGRVPVEGTAHFAVNEGSQAAHTIIIEIKGQRLKKSATSH